MLRAESFARGAAYFSRRCLGSIVFLLLLTGCSFHSAQLNFVQGVLKKLNAKEAAVNYWMLTLPGVTLRAVPIIDGDRLFFSDGEKYLVSVGAESVAGIRALDTGIAQKLTVRKESQVEKSVAGLPPSGESGHALSINEPSEDGLAIDGGLILLSKTGLPDTIYFCSNWVYSSDERSSNKLCQNREGRILKFTHNLDDLGVVKRFNVVLDDQLLINLERTSEVISY